MDRQHTLGNPAATDLTDSAVPGGADAAAAEEAALVDEVSLVEEVSIDGMCGVY